MYNTELPNRAELPSARQLLRSTLVAAAVAGVLLVTVVMPAEYGVDPTGVGRVLGLQAMGETKMALAREAAETAGAPSGAATRNPGAPPAAAAAAAVAAPGSASASVDTGGAGKRTDEISVLLKPGQGTEIKLDMRQGEKVAYRWEVTDGVVNYDAHGDSDGAAPVSHSYKKGTRAQRDEGTLEARFDGKHGWYWRNRGKERVVVTLRTQGQYSAIGRVN